MSVAQPEGARPPSIDEQLAHIDVVFVARILSVGLFENQALKDLDPSLVVWGRRHQIIGYEVLESFHGLVEPIELRDIDPNDPAATSCDYAFFVPGVVPNSAVLVVASRREGEAVVSYRVIPSGLGEERLGTRAIDMDDPSDLKLLEELRSYRSTGTSARSAD